MDDITVIYLYFSAAVIGSLLVAFMPLFVALIVARLSVLPRRFLFSITCAIVVYGMTVLAYIVQLPLQVASFYLAPTWSQLGYQSFAGAIVSSANWLGYATALVPVTLTIALPLFLKSVWRSLVAALSANN